MKLEANFLCSRSIQEMNNHGCPNFLLLDFLNNNYFFVFCSFIEIYFNGQLGLSYSSLTFIVPGDYQSRLSSFMCVHNSILPFYLYSRSYCMFYSPKIYKGLYDRYFEVVKNHALSMIVCLIHMYFFLEMLEFIQRIEGSLSD